MPQPNKIHYDAASALSQGRRDRQEDAVAVDFPVGAPHGFAVLADGMGGHAAGDVASQIVVTEMFSELKMLISDPKTMEKNIRDKLCAAIQDTNMCIEHMANSSPDVSVMGATALVPVIFGERLYWVSVGDSPLFLYREGKLDRLNEDHSMAPQIDEMQTKGLINLDEARNHPDRSALTSVLAGTEIPKIDCSGAPVSLQSGDIVIAASDGLEYLSPERIEDVLAAYQTRPSTEISAALLREIEALDDPDQDNVSLCLIKVKGEEEDHAAVPDPIAAVTKIVQADQASRPSSVTVLSRKSGGASQVVCVSRKVKM